MAANAPEKHAVQKLVWRYVIIDEAHNLVDWSVLVVKHPLLRGGRAGLRFALEGCVARHGGWHGGRWHGGRRADGWSGGRGVWGRLGWGLGRAWEVLGRCA